MEVAIQTPSVSVAVEVITEDLCHLEELQALQMEAQFLSEDLETRASLEDLILLEVQEEEQEALAVDIQHLSTKESFESFLHEIFMKEVF